jgi:hypothetical protein
LARLVPEDPHAVILYSSACALPLAQIGPYTRFERDERPLLRPSPMRALPTREQRLSRRVAHDAVVDVDTVAR